MKALFRRAKAYMGIKENEKAHEDLIKASQLDATNAEVRKELRVVKERLQGERQEEKKLFGTMLKPGLYEDAKPEPEPKTRKCTVSEQGVPNFQLSTLIFAKINVLS